MVEKSPIEGKVVDASALVAVPQAFDALTRLVETAGKCVAIHAEEARKRESLRTYRETELATITAAEVTLQRYFADVFSERRAIYQQLFRTMDQALEDGNAEVLHAVVTGIVDLAKDSPLAAAGDLGKLRAAFDDPNQVWSF